MPTLLEQIRIKSSGGKAITRESLEKKQKEYHVKAPYKQKKKVKDEKKKTTESGSRTQVETVERKDESKEQLDYILEHSEPKQRERLQQVMDRPVRVVPDYFIQQIMFRKASESAYRSLSNEEKIEYIKRYATFGPENKTWEQIKQDHPYSDIRIVKGEPQVVTPEDEPELAYRYGGEQYSQHGSLGAGVRAVSIVYPAMFRPETYIEAGKGVIETGRTITGGGGTQAIAESVLRWEYQLQQKPDTTTRFWEIIQPAYVNVVIPFTFAAGFGLAFKGIQSASLIGGTTGKVLGTFASVGPKVGLASYGAIESHRIGTSFIESPEKGIAASMEGVSRFSFAHAGAVMGYNFKPTVGVQRLGSNQIAFQKHITSFRGKPIIPYGKPLVLTTAPSGPQVTVVTPFVRGQLGGYQTFETFGYNKQPTAISTDVTIGYYDGKVSIDPVRPISPAWQMKTGIPEYGIYTGRQLSTVVYPKMQPYWYTLIGKVFLYSIDFSEYFGYKVKPSSKILDLKPKPKIVDVGKQLSKTEQSLDKMPSQTQQGGLKTIQIQKQEQITIQRTIQKQEQIPVYKKLSELASATKKKTELQSASQLASKLSFFHSQQQISLSVFQSAQLLGSAILSASLSAQVQERKMAQQLLLGLQYQTLQKQQYKTLQGQLSLQASTYAFSPMTISVFASPTLSYINNTQYTISPKTKIRKQQKTPVRKPRTPKLPMFDPLIETEKKEGQGFDVYVKDRYYVGGRQKYTERFIKMNKRPLAERDALRFGGTVVDQSAAQSFYIKPTQGKPQKPSIPTMLWQPLQMKFYKRKNIYIERRINAIDTIGEINDISARGWVQNQRMMMGNIPKPSKTRRKRGKPSKTLSLDNMLRNIGRMV